MDEHGTRAGWLECGLVLVVLLALMLVVAPSVDQILNTRDHGVHLARAVQIDLGRHPFVDYPGGVYGPLVFYLSYLAQELSGWCLLGEVVLDACGYALGYLLLYATCRRVGGSRGVAIAALLAGVLLMPRFYKYYILLGPAVFLFALELGCRRGFRPATLCLLALATCIAGFFRLDYGAYALFVSVLCFALATAPGRRWDSLRWLAWYAISGLLFSAPFLVLLVLRANPVEVLGDTIALVSGAKSGLGKGLAPELQGLSRFQLAFWGFRALPFAVLAALLAARFGLLALFARERRLELRSETCFVPGASVFAALVFMQATHRVDPQHLLQVLPAGLVLLAWVAGTLRANLRPAIGRFSVIALFALPVLLLGDQRERFDELPTPSRLAGNWRDYGKSRAELRQGDDWDQDIATWITELYPPGTDVLMLPYWPQLYYLAGRGYGTRFGWIYPGLFNGRFTEAAFLESLEGTPIVADEVGFSFDYDPERDARAYAPELMQALYQDRAIVYGHGYVLVLTNDARLLSGVRFPGSFRPCEATYESRPAGWFGITTINTLDWTSPVPLRTIRGGALLIGGALRTRPQGDLWVLLRGETSYRARAEVRPADEGFMFQCMADTRAVPLGVYDVEVAVGSPPDGRRTRSGRRVEVVELP